MARGNFRNWDEIVCSAGCGHTLYSKNAKRLGVEKYCVSCFEKASMRSTINSIEDLPNFMKKYARMWKNYPKDIIVVFPMPTELTEADVKAIPITKKFIKTNGGGYDDRGHWYIPLSQGKGWHELPDASGKAPEHVAASQQLSFSDILKQPMQKQESFDEHLIAMIRIAVEQDPHRLSHGDTKYNAFWIDGNQIVPYNDHKKVMGSKGVISVHSHSGENWKDYNEKTDELQPLNGGDLEGLSHMVKYGYGDTLALISAYGELEYIRFTKDSSRQFVSLSPQKLMKSTEVPHEAAEEFISKGMGTTYDLWRKLMASFCDNYRLEYHTGLRWK